MRLNYFDYFRAIAIIFIVAGHSFYPWRIDTRPEMVVANLITGDTALFVFISGFFFHHIFYPKFQYAEFLLKKSKNVFLPYIILSSCGFLFYVVILNEPSPHITGDLSSLADSIWLYLKYLWTGRIIFSYWYVSFIMIIFAGSPLFIMYINLSIKSQLYVLFLSITLSMLIHRPLHNISPIHSVIYFTPVYMIGILYSINEQSISHFIKNKSFILGIATLLISAFQVMRNNSFGNFHKATMMSYAGIDIVIIQKIFMIFFFLSILRKIDNKEIAILKYIASVSFAIYFLHPWVLRFLAHISVIEYISFLPEIIIFPVKTSLVIGLSIATATFIKMLFGKRSRHIIGW